jgi:hypothetical protein
MRTTTKINKRSPKWYGWLPDLPDHRDFFYSAIAPRLTTLPRKIDMRSKCSPVEDQGQLGSCTANALVGALEFLELKDGAPFVDLSGGKIGRVEYAWSKGEGCRRPRSTGGRLQRQGAVVYHPKLLGQRLGTKRLFRHAIRLPLARQKSGGRFLDNSCRARRLTISIRKCGRVRIWHEG